MTPANLRSPPWTEEEDQILLSDAASGLKRQVTAAKIGRAIDAVYWRLSYLRDPDRVVRARMNRRRQTVRNDADGRISFLRSRPGVGICR